MDVKSAELLQGDAANCNHYKGGLDKMDATGKESLQQWI
jgi:hypothetical protein